jgi:ABC-type sulfate transport system permease component
LLNHLPWDVFVAIDFSDRILITNPTAYHLGRSIVFLGLIAITIGVIAWFRGDILVPAMVWFVAALPTTVIGVILIISGLTKP